MAREITYNNFEISLVVFMPNIATNHAITYTNGWKWRQQKLSDKFPLFSYDLVINLAMIYYKQRLEAGRS